MEIQTPAEVYARPRYPIRQRIAELLVEKRYVIANFRKVSEGDLYIGTSDDDPCILGDRPGEWKYPSGKPRFIVLPTNNPLAGLENLDYWWPQAEDCFGGQVIDLAQFA